MSDASVEKAFLVRILNQICDFVSNNRNFKFFFARNCNRICKLWCCLSRQNLRNSTPKSTLSHSNATCLVREPISNNLWVSHVCFASGCFFPRKCFLSINFPYCLWNFWENCFFLKFYIHSKKGEKFKAKYTYCIKIFDEPKKRLRYVWVILCTYRNVRRKSKLISGR